MQGSRLASLKSLAFLAGTIVLLWHLLCNKQWEVIMETHPLLRKSRHRAVIMLVIPLRTRLIHNSLSYWPICRLFKIIIEWELSIRLQFKSSVMCKSIVSKNSQPDMNYILKNTQLQKAAWTLKGCSKRSPGKARVNKFERTLTTNDIFWYMWPAAWTRKARPSIKWKHMNSAKAQWKELE